MPREIADSDDELEAAIPAPHVKHIRRTASTIGSRNGVELLDADPIMNIDFDALCSPTQRLSSSDRSNENAIDPATSLMLDSSTNRFLNEVAPTPSSASRAGSHTEGSRTTRDMGTKVAKQDTKAKVGKKRERTQAQDGMAKHSSQVNSPRKRARTDSMSPRVPKSAASMKYHVMVDGGSDSLLRSKEQREEALYDVAGDLEPLVSVDQRTQYTSPLDLSLHLSPSAGTVMPNSGDTIEIDEPSAQSYLPHQPYSAPTTFFGANLHGGTTSKSSMGNYQSYTINPHAIGGGVGYETNPFGTPSQISTGGDDDHDQRAINEVFRRSASNTTIAGIVNTELLSEMQTSPLYGSVDGPEELDSAKGMPPQASPEFSPITNPDDNLTIEPAQLFTEPQLPTHDKIIARENEALKPQPKKRGRPKRKVDDVGVDGQDNIDELHLDDHNFDRAIRAGTVDSVSNISEISHASTGSKRGRKRKTKKSEMSLPEVPPKKLPSSDLGLDRKDVIGLSPERYKPRPSRRARGRGQPEPLSEVVPKAEVIETWDKSSVQHEVDLAQDGIPTIEKSSNEPTSIKGKKGKKTKAKQSKNDVVVPEPEKALDDEDDKAESETIDLQDKAIGETISPIPAGSEDMKSNLGVDGIEVAVNEDSNTLDDDEVESKGTSRRDKVTIDIPKLSKPNDHQEPALPIPAPKKRGRKRKKQAEEPVEVPEDAHHDEDERPVLAEKDANVQPKKARGSKSKPMSKEAGPEESVAVVEEDEEHAKESVQAASESADLVSTPMKSATKVETPVAKAPPSSSKSLGGTPLLNARARIGLSKRHSIPSLLRKVDRNKEAPKAIERKEKLNKRQLEEREAERIAREEAEAEGREYVPPDQMRGKDGRLIEWDF
ncbi:hypothetical protein LTS08_003136 [Lithohypha guttulata]|nr:hypothetical protein LTS08_003136 [Lithohypha guttulata]